jgi:hypothetical protein
MMHCTLSQTLPIFLSTLCVCVRGLFPSLEEEEEEEAEQRFLLGMMHCALSRLSVFLSLSTLCVCVWIVPFTRGRRRRRRRKASLGDDALYALSQLCVCVCVWIVPFT